MNFLSRWFNEKRIKQQEKKKIKLSEALANDFTNDPNDLLHETLAEKAQNVKDSESGSIQFGSCPKYRPQQNKPDPIIGHPIQANTCHQKM